MRTGAGGVGDQGQGGAAEDDPDADPDPHDQRVDVGFENWAARVLVQALVDQVEIFVQGRSYEGHGRSLAAGFVKAALGRESVDLFAAFEYVHNGPLGGVVGKLLVGV